MKIALITGGSRGIGKSSALAVAKSGTDVIITYLSQRDAASEVVREIQSLGRKAVALQLDARDSSSFSKFADTVKSALKEHWNTDRFDFLVNNAGSGAYNAFAETTEQQFDEMVAVHFKGPYFLTQKLLPFMKDGGRILNFSSGLSRFSYPGYSAYAAMKGAIDTLTRFQAVELGARKIVVNSIAPGAIETDFGGGQVRDNKDLNHMIASQTPLGRVGLPDDIGELVASMLSEHTRWVNGQRIEAAGGIHA